MRAALVTAFAAPPEYAEVPDPQADGPDDEIVDLVGAALAPRVRSQADGSHYTSRGTLPLIPGVDGVGRDDRGRLRYFVLPETDRGAMAERVLIDRRRSVVLPDDVDPITIAAAMNPAMSSWIALRRRVELPPAARVLILGATGNAGRLAVRIAKRLGAARVVGAGRDPGRLALLPGLGADGAVDLGADPAAAAAALAAAGRDVDVVLDYLWGAPAAAAMRAIVPARSDDGQQLTWVQIGSVAGPEAPIPSAALRACRLRIVGSGQGSVPAREILDELPALAREITSGEYAVSAVAVPLADVAAAWGRTGDRIVLVP